MVKNVLILAHCVALLLGLPYCPLLAPSALALSYMDVPAPNGKPLFHFIFRDQGEESAYENTTSVFTLDAGNRAALKDGVQYWATMLGPWAQNTQAVDISFITLEHIADLNASAVSTTEDGAYTLLNGPLAGQAPITDPEFDDAMAVIMVQRLVGAEWLADVGPLQGLRKNGNNTIHMASTIAHEMMHALGMSTNTLSPVADSYTFGAKENFNLWDASLRDMFGQAAQPNMPIVSTGTPTPGAFVTDGSHNYTGMYFTGTHVAQVLGGVSLAWPDGERPDNRVPGLPINGWEGSPEFSHIELQNSLMSHQNYRNWLIPMEAELAAMQDVGLTLDRRNFFGFSVYGDGQTLVNTNPYYARNATGTGWIAGQYNTTANGLGLHIYGSNNSLSQGADLLTSGAFAMGIRVDGTENTLNILPDVRVHANGWGGNALVVSYGKEHNVIHRGDLQAMGTGGVAARFDFGGNPLGDMAEVRGSYIRVYEGADSTLLDVLKGPLVARFDISGRLVGSGAAIYISENAFVRDISILRGAVLGGDIISLWDPAASRVQYTGNPADLTTTLTFGLAADGLGQATGSPDPNFGLRYTGNIFGEKSLHMQVAGGALSFNGLAKVLDVGVASGATLSGNALYELSGSSLVGLSSTFTNAGTVAPGNSLGSIGITGDYTQKDTGTLHMEFDSAGRTDHLAVSGTATLNGKMRLQPVLDYYTGSMQFTLANMLSAGSVSGDFTASQLVNQSPTLTILMQQRGAQLASTYSITSSRASNAYSRYATTDNARNAGRAVDAFAAGIPAGLDLRNLVAALDFSALDGSTVGQALHQMTPAAYANTVLATFDLHHMLSDMLLLPAFSSAGGASLPAGEEWRSFIQPFAGTIFQPARDGMGGYTATHMGFLGGVERRTAKGLLLGGHLAFNHQSTLGDVNGQLHGEGLYVGLHGRYAPEDWGGWNLFSVGRVGLESQRMRRDVEIDAYQRSNTADWTSWSASLRVGGGYDYPLGDWLLGPLVALDYSFAALPDIHESVGGGSRLQLDAAAFQSTRSLVGARLSSTVMPLNARASWTVQATATWNHEWLTRAGVINAAFAEAPQASFANQVEVPGRDSLGLNGGLSVYTDSNVTFSLSAGSELFRHKGTGVYGNMAVEWTF